MPVNGCIQGKPILVTIIGASGAGKSQLAKATASALGDERASRIPADYFFLPRRSEESLESFLQRSLEYDWRMIRRCLALPIGSLVLTPDAYFVTFTRRGESGGVEFRISPVMICDSMTPCPDADVVGLLEVPDAVRRDRIRARDERWGTRIQDRMAHVEATWRESNAIRPHLVLDGTLPLVTNSQRLVEMINEMQRSGVPIAGE